MVMISPVRATRKPAPAATLMFRTVTVKAHRSAQLGLIVREGILGLGHADGHLVVAQLGQGLDLLFCVGREVHGVTMIDLLDNGLDLLLDGQIQLIGEGEVVGLIAQADDLLGQLYAAFAALGPKPRTGPH